MSTVAAYASHAHWEYDAHDQVTQVRVTKTRPDGSTYDDVKSMTYDEFDRLDEVTGRGQLVDYAYDRNGNRTGVTSPGGTTTYEFDSMNRLTVAHVDGEDTTLGYGADGLLSTVTHPNGTEAKYTYDASKRIETVTHRVVSNDAVVARYVYGYDHDGNRTTEVATQHGETETSAYAFDVLGRLLGEARTQADGSIRTTSYTYEGYDRKTERVLEGGAEAVLRTYAYDAQHRLERVDVHTPDADYAVAYGYDANGNTVHREDSRHPELAVSFVYDSQDRMVEAIRGPPASEQSLGHYDYDDAGLRIRHHGGTRGDVDYLYDGGSVLEERNAGDASLRAHYRYAHELLTVDVPGQARSTYHHDALGSTEALTGASGQTEATYRVDPFGAIRERTGSSPNRFVFTGHEHDEETGLVYMRARFYDPETGRFLTQDCVLGDPSEPPSLHRYLYANANPLRFVDPTGHIPWASGVADEDPDSWRAPMRLPQKSLDFRSGMLDQGARDAAMRGAPIASAPLPSKRTGATPSRIVPRMTVEDPSGTRPTATVAVVQADPNHPFFDTDPNHPIYGSDMTAWQFALLPPEQTNALLLADHQRRSEALLRDYGIAPRQSVLFEMQDGSLRMVTNCADGVCDEPDQYEPFYGITEYLRLRDSTFAYDYRTGATRSDMMDAAVMSIVFDASLEIGGLAYEFGGPLLGRMLSSEARAARGVRVTAGPYDEVLSPELFDERTVRTFANRFPNEAAGRANILRLERRGDRWVTVSSSGEVFSPKGRYIFVVQDGEILAARTGSVMGPSTPGHIDIAGGRPVEFAGEAYFAGTRKRGVMRYWTNGSGHYQPPVDWAHQSGLPTELFRSFKK